MANRLSRPALALTLFVPKAATYRAYAGSLAIQEDVDVIGISILSGAHMTIFPRVLKLLADRGADDILVIGGGVIPDDDVAALTAQGVKALILQDTPPDAIVAAVRRVVAERGAR